MFPIGEENPGYARYFTGRSYLAVPFTACRYCCGSCPERITGC